jgi:hypothetical protein
LVVVVVVVAFDGDERRPPTPRRQQVPGNHRDRARWGGDALAALGTTAYVLGLASWCAAPRAVAGCSSDRRQHARLGG